MTFSNNTIWREHPLNLKTFNQIHFTQVYLNSKPNIICNVCIYFSHIFRQNQSIFLSLIGITCSMHQTFFDHVQRVSCVFTRSFHFTLALTLTNFPFKHFFLIFCLILKDTSASKSMRKRKNNGIKKYLF